MIDYALTHRYTEGPLDPPDDSGEWEVVSTCGIGGEGVAITWRRVAPEVWEACVVEHG
jgi:hypothetical protein